MQTTFSLVDLGWRPVLQQQLALDELGLLAPARVAEQARSGYRVITEAGEKTLLVLSSMPPLVVGDWVLLDQQKKFKRLLEPFSDIKRKAAGTDVQTQRIAANVDVLFIVMSLNDDFNLNRLERFLALAHQSDVTPVAVLTKADLCADVTGFIDQVRKRAPTLDLFAVNALDAQSILPLRTYLKAGQTIALVGSSGTGKSTLTNRFLGREAQGTQGIREDDSKGRHTTTARSLLPIPGGGWVLDTPGVREIQLVDAAEGVRVTFADIEALALRCRFNDCAHESEPGCAVQAALKSGELDASRLENYRKLQREDRRHSETLAQKRARSKQFGKMVNSHLKQKKRDQGLK